MMITAAWACRWRWQGLTWQDCRIHRRLHGRRRCTQPRRPCCSRSGRCRGWSCTAWCTRNSMIHRRWRWLSGPPGRWGRRRGPCYKPFDPPFRCCEKLICRAWNCSRVVKRWAWWVDTYSRRSVKAMSKWCQELEISVWCVRQEVVFVWAAASNVGGPLVHSWSELVNGETESSSGC